MKKNLEPGFVPQLVLLLTLILLPTLGLVGCGGGTSKEDLMRAAMRTSGDEDEEEDNHSKSAPTKQNQRRNNAQDKSNNDKDQAEPSTPNGNNGRSNAVARSDNDRSSHNEADSTTTAPETVNVPEEVVSIQSDFVPAENLVERRRRSIENMEKISAGILAYVKEKGTMPKPAIVASDGEPLLSWRVQLLPYYGYRWLYDQFDLDEPWDSEVNLALLKKVPDIFRDPQLGGENCPYLLPIGSFTAFPSGRRQVLARRIEDGLDKTIILVEVDEKHAVPWTKPEDITIIPASPWTNLDELYPDGFIAAWGDGQIYRIFAHSPNDKVRALFTIDGGERVRASLISAVATPEILFAGDEPGANELASTPTTDDETTTNQEPATNDASSGLPDQDSATARRFDALAFESAQNNELVTAFQQKHLATLLYDPKIATRFYGWSPALERPVLGLRWGVGVHGSIRQFTQGPEPIGNENELDDYRSGLPGEKELEYVTGELGLRISGLMRSELDAGKFGTFVPATNMVVEKSRSNRDNRTNFKPLMHHPGIYILGNGNERVLRHLGDRYDVDLIMKYDLDLKYTRQRKVHNTTTVSIFDAQSGEELWKWRGLNNIRVALDRQDPLKDDPVRELLTDLQRAFSEELAVVELPDLTPDQARARIDRMLADPAENPLAMLAELHVYLGLGVISEYEYRTTAVALTENEEAAILATGTASEKAAFLEQWIKGEPLE